MDFCFGCAFLLLMFTKMMRNVSLQYVGDENLQYSLIITHYDVSYKAE